MKTRDSRQFPFHTFRYTWPLASFLFQFFSKKAAPFSVGCRSAGILPLRDRSLS